MSVISSWQQEMGLDDEQMAALLSERLGKDISVGGYQRMGKRQNVPAAWLDALELSPQEPGSPRPKRKQEVVEPTMALDVASAKTQLTLIYTFAGKGASIALRSPDVAGIWAGHAPRIADAYVRWAETNATVRQVLSYLTLGGPAGELVLLHATLIVGTLVASERLDVNMFVPPPAVDEETEHGSREGAAEDDGNVAPEPKPASRPRRRSGAASAVDEPGEPPAE